MLETVLQRNSMRRSAHKQSFILPLFRSNGWTWHKTVIGTLVSWFVQLISSRSFLVSMHSLHLWAWLMVVALWPWSVSMVSRDRRDRHSTGICKGFWSSPSWRSFNWERSGCCCSAAKKRRHTNSACQMACEFLNCFLLCRPVEMIYCNMI